MGLYESTLKNNACVTIPQLLPLSTSPSSKDQQRIYDTSDIAGVRKRQ